MGLMLTLYILIWPVIAAAVLYVICSAFFKEWRQARRDADDLV